jgi:hypothetical protein
MARNTVVFDNFQGGEFGSIRDWKAQRNMFTGQNMLVNRAGELMVRPGLVNRTPAGVGVGIVQGFGSVGVPTQDAWYVQGSTVRTFDILSGNNLEVASGSLSGTPTSVVSSVTVTNVTYLTALGLTTSYVLSTVPATPTLTALTGAPAGRCITSYGDRLIIGDVETSLDNRIRFSDALNPNSWPAANFIDIGDGWGIRGMTPQRQHLVIAKQTGFYVLTGVPGVNPVLRKITDRSGPVTPNDMALMKNDLVGYLAIDAPQPGLFDGSRAKELFHLDNQVTQYSSETLPIAHGVANPHERHKDGLIVIDNTEKAMFLRNGVWTYHTFGVPVSGLISTNQGRLYLCDGGAAGTAPKFYIWNHWAETPGLTTGDQMMPGDDSTTALSGNVTFPEWWAENAAEVRVRAVIVDFRKWQNGASNNNHFDLRVDMLRRYNNTSPVASNTVSFDESPLSSSTTGTLDRRVFGFGEQGMGNGFQLVFSDVRGMAIQRVEVVIDTEPVRV